MSNIQSFEDLECWKAAKVVRLFIAEITATLPNHEKYDLADTMKRAARSCTRNIAEGYGRFHYQENIQFCRISRGSMMELIDDLITCLDEKYISETRFIEGKALILKAIKILNGYIAYLERAKANNTSKNVSEPESIYMHFKQVNNPIT